MSLQNLLVRVGADVKDFEKNMNQVQKQLNDVSKRVGDAGKALTTWVTGPIVAATTGLALLALRAGQTADRILDLSAITGLSTDSIQEWQYAARVAGVDIEAVTKASEGLIRRLPQIAKEGGPASEALEKLGVSVYGANGQMKQADDILDDLLYSLAAMPDPLERNAHGSALFGGAWKDLAPILSMGTDGIKEAREEAQRLGLVMSGEALESANEYRIAVDRLKAMFNALWLELGTKIAPILQERLVPIIEESVIPALRTFVDWVISLITWFTDLDPKWQKTIATAIGFAAAIGPLLVLVSKFTGLVSALAGVLPTLGSALAFLTGPIGLVIAAVTAMIVVWQLWGDDIKRIVQDVWDVVARVFDGMVKTVVSAVKLITAPIVAMIDLIKSALDWISRLSGQKAVSGAGDMSGNAPTVMEQALQGVDHFHTGGQFRAPTPGGEGLAMLKDREYILTPNQMAALAGGGGSQVIVVELDGRQIAKAQAPHMVSEIRLKTGLRI